MINKFFKNTSNPQSVKLGDGHMVDTQGIGTVEMKITSKLGDVEIFFPGSGCQERKHSDIQKVSLLHMRKGQNS